jgi:hypothetical protein
MTNSINTPERRQSERLRVNLPVSFEQFYGLKTKQASLTRDISTSGLRMNVDGYFPLNTQFSFNLDLPEIQKKINGIIQITWAQRISYSDRYQMGLKFCGMLPEEKNVLKDYLCKIKSRISS